MMMGLRLTEGVPLARIRAECGADAERWIDGTRLRDLAEEGYIERGDGRIRATAAGRQRLDAVLTYLMAANAGSESPDHCVG